MFGFVDAEAAMRLEIEAFGKGQVAAFRTVENRLFELRPQLRIEMQTFINPMLIEVTPCRVSEAGKTMAALQRVPHAMPESKEQVQ